MPNKRTRKTIITYGVFAVVLIALVLYIVLRRSDRMQYDVPTVDSVEASSILAITIEEANSTIEMSRDGDEWYILPDRFKVDPGMASDMIDSIAEFELTDLVSTSKSYERYELDDAKAMKIVASGSNTDLLEFYLGKRAPSYNHSYVRLPGDDNVYHAATDLRRVFDKDIGTLRDKNVLAFTRGDVVRIGVTTPERELQLSKSTSQVSTENQAGSALEWTASDGSEWAPEKIDELLDRIDDLRCTSFVEDTQANLGDPILVLQIQTQQQNTLSLFEKQDDSYPATSSQTPFAFYVSEFVGDSVIDTFSTGDNDD